MVKMEEVSYSTLVGRRVGGAGSTVDLGCCWGLGSMGDCRFEDCSVGGFCWGVCRPTELG
jgi:hypothetical protein